MEKIRKGLMAAILLSEVSHLFCCVLPVLAAVASLLVGAGFLPALAWPLHDLIHRYEVPLIVFSAVIIAAGWGVYLLALRTDCQALGHHEAHCHKVTRKTRTVLVIGTALFLFNLAVYLFLHRELGILEPPGAPAPAHESLNNGL